LLPWVHNSREVRIILVWKETWYISHSRQQIDSWRFCSFREVTWQCFSSIHKGVDFPVIVKKILSSDCKAGHFNVCQILADRQSLKLIFHVRFVKRFYSSFGLIKYLKWLSFSVVKIYQRDQSLQSSGESLTAKFLSRAPKTTRHHDLGYTRC